MSLQRGWDERKYLVGNRDKIVGLVMIKTMAFTEGGTEMMISLEVCQLEKINAFIIGQSHRQGLVCVEKETINAFDFL